MSIPVPQAPFTPSQRSHGASLVPWTRYERRVAALAFLKVTGAASFSVPSVLSDTDRKSLRIAPQALVSPLTTGSLLTGDHQLAVVRVGSPSRPPKRSCARGRPPRTPAR